MNQLVQFFKNNSDVQTVREGIENGMKEQLVTGLSSTAKGMFMSAVTSDKKKRTIVIVHQLLQANELYDDLVELNGEDHVFLYPVNELIAAEMAISSPELEAQRVRALTYWLNTDDGILIAPIAALKRILPPKHYWQKYRIHIEELGRVDLDQLLLSLVHMGYKRVDMVTAAGEFSVRGGIIDIYPLTETYPVRIELFGDEVDSLRYFDVADQRSLEKVTEVSIGPASEWILTDEDYSRAAKGLASLLEESMKKMKQSEAKELTKDFIEGDLEKLEARQTFQGMYKYSGLFYEAPHSLLDYLDDDSLLLFDEFIRVQESAQLLDKEEAEFYESMLQLNEAIPGLTFSHDWYQIQSKIHHQRIYMSLFLRHIPNTKPENIVNISSHPMQDFHGQMSLFENELNRWLQAEFSVVLFVPNQKRAEKVQAILRDYHMPSVIKADIEFGLKEPLIVIGNFSKGVELPTFKLALLTEKELFNKKVTRKRKTQHISNAERIKSYQELAIGDYVVHRNHGIGKYLGIETLKVAKLHKDFLLIKYSGDDKLYVPIDQIDLVQKYVGSEGKEPRVYKLGGTEWTRVKRKVQSSVEDIADELIKLYAERQAQRGYAFDPDSDLQREFELNFPYDPTDDQIRSIEEIKQDMEQERPMDRLLCGDVGYGKTEVALRAAFKAIVEGKQVAFLVPTTILAQQHYQTMLERFSDYPINIGLLSRFRTRKQQAETIEGLKNGTVDVVVGTHRLLSKDIKYRDLGLLIVDEEQRFGVKHKEAIKQIKTNVDVLTLTATPIPRTLHMSMLGIRDLSVIETPPENRFPIQTYVMEKNRMLVKEVIERELARGGQVYVLNNRIENIDKVAQEIEGLVEGVSVSTAHGRMNESELEHVMLNFLEGESDVLVSTTIIETGVDIPNVNTLIVYDADHMGLSQLYQLRGRVGRSNRVAYAYFMYQKDKVLNEVAEKRLQAIKEFTELGSGFKIAMRDLSIRGAGNLLGAQQHGFIDSVGFDLYSQMLKEAIEARKTGQKTEAVAPFNPEITLPIDAYIPSDYITDEQQKIDMYKRFQSFDTEEKMRDLQDEMIDRYGDYPEEVEQLFAVSLMRMYAKQERVESIQEQNNRTVLLIEDNRSQKIDGAKLFELASTYGRTVQLGTTNNQLKITFKWTKESSLKRLDMITEFIQALKGLNFTE